MSNKRHTQTIWLISLLCILPVFLSTTIYFFAPPSGGKSVGELLPIETFSYSQQAQWPRKTWVLVSQLDSNCQDCAKRLEVMDHIQRAQGELKGKLTLIALRNEDKSQIPHSFLSFPILKTDKTVRKNGFYLIDPLGHQVLFYQNWDQPKKIIQEIQKMMKTNNGLA